MKVFFITGGPGFLFFFGIEPLWLLVRKELQKLYGNYIPGAQASRDAVRPRPQEPLETIIQMGKYGQPNPMCVIYS